MSEIAQMPKPVERVADLTEMAKFRCDVHGPTNHVMGRGDVIFCIACNMDLARGIASVKSA